MKLLEAVLDLETLDEESTIYAAEPWAEGSTVVIEREPANGGLPEEATKLGLKYFLEVFIARDFLEDWTANLGDEPSLSEKCKRLIYYAINDA